METLKELFGEGENLSVLQMSMRGVVIFFICLLLIRLSGRRSFGMHTPLDNVITILLGAVLSKAVLGTSSFWAVIAAACSIVFLHRLCAWIGLYSRLFGTIVKGEAKILYSDGKINQRNMRYCMVSEKDLMEGIRQTANLNSLEKIKTVFIERNGKISVIKKED